MGLRIVVVITVLALSLLAQVQATRVSGPRGSETSVATGLLDLTFGSVAVADNADGDNDDTDDNIDGEDNDDIDNDDIDNDSADADADNDDADNDDADNDDADNDSSTAASDPNEDVVIENVSPAAGASTAATPAPTAAAPASAAAPAAPATAGTPATEISGTSTGGDTVFALPNDRIVVRMFPSMRAGITLTLRLIDPVTVPAAPGTRVGDLIFVLEARDSAGAALTTLPAEVNVDIAYTDQETGFLNDQAVTLSRLNPATSQWTTAPKLVTKPEANTLAASIMELGTYVVSIP